MNVNRKSKKKKIISQTLAFSNKKISGGFTLFEFVIYLALMGSVLIALVSFALSVISVRSKVYVAQESQANGRMALDFIAQKIRSADKIFLPAPGETSSELSLDMPDSESNLIFNVNDGTLEVIRIGSDPLPLNSGEVMVDSLSFTNLARGNQRDNIKVEMIISYRRNTSREYDYSQRLQTTVSRRH